MRSDLIGRRAELERLSAAWSERPLVTVVGPFGVGKTRLSQELLDEQTFWLDLSLAMTPTEFEQTFVRNIGVDSEDIEGVVRALKSRGATRLIIDNAEQILETVARWVNRLVERSDIRVLVTSRSPLYVDGEHVFRIDPLSEEDALSLFQSRLSLVDASLNVGGEFTPKIREFLHVLDRLPLVVELAAGRIGTVGLADMQTDLSSLFDTIKTFGLTDRQSSVEGAVKWSWNLLSEAERRALEAVSVFRGPFDFAYFEAVVPDGTMALLRTLVDRSLLYVERPSLLSHRYALFESVRRFVVRRSGDIATAARADLSRLVERETRALWATRYQEPRSDWLKKVASNAHHYLSVLESVPDASTALVLDDYYRSFGTLAVRKNVLDLGPNSDDVLSARAEWGLAAGRIDDVAESVSTIGDVARRSFLSAKLAQIRGDEQGFIAAIESAKNAELDDPVLESLILAAAGSYEPTHFERALSISKKIADRSVEARIRNAIGAYRTSSGEFGEAKRQYDIATELLETDDSPRLSAAISANLGLVSHYLGELESAAVACRAARATFDRRGFIRESAIMQGNEAAVEIDRGRYELASELLADARLVLEQSGSDALVRVMALSGLLSQLRGNLSRAREFYAADGVEDVDFIPVVFAVLEFDSGDLDAAKLQLNRVDGSNAIWSYAGSFVADKLGLPREIVDPATLPKHVRDLDEAKWSFARLLPNDASSGPVFEIANDGSWCTNDGTRIELGRRGPAKKLLVWFAKHPGGVFDLDALFEVGWPGQKIDVDSAHKRVYAAIGTLRRLGLETAIETTEEGYRLMERFHIVWTEA